MGRNERVEHDGYAEQEPEDVARQLADAAQLLGNVLARLDVDDWDRTVVYHYQKPMNRHCGGSRYTPCMRRVTTSSTFAARRDCSRRMCPITVTVSNLRQMGLRPTSANVRAVIQSEQRPCGARQGNRRQRHIRAAAWRIPRPHRVLGLDVYGRSPQEWKDALGKSGGVTAELSEYGEQWFREGEPGRLVSHL